jgi:hypothetical protein
MSLMNIYLQISRQNEKNIKSINIRLIIIIIVQIQNMKIKLNMKDINKILAKAHFKSLSSLHFSLMFSEGEVKSPYFSQVW